MKYNQYAIESLKDKLIELSMKSSTPKKYAANMFEAYEVIKQLQREIKDKEKAGDKEGDNKDKYQKQIMNRFCRKE